MELAPLLAPLSTLTLALLAWKAWKGGQGTATTPGHLPEGAQVVDVRSRREFQGGHRQGSINIPLQELGARMGELDRERPVVLCCASGSRSAYARTLLHRAGFINLVDAGPWTRLP